MDASRKPLVISHWWAPIALPTFPAGFVAPAIGKNTSCAVADFRRFRVVHLWGEDFLELFTTIMVACIFVPLGVVPVAVATTVICPDIILYSVGGILPIVCLALRTFYRRNRPATVGVEESAGEFVTKPS